LRVLVFDLDDTLYLERDFARSGFRAAGEWLKSTIGIGDLEARCRALFESGQRERIFNLALEGLGVGDSETLKRLIEVYRTHAPEIALAPDADRYLRSLPVAQKTALISDGPAATQLAKVRALDLERRIAKVICTGVWGRAFWKPHPRAFEEVERWVGPDAPQFVYVADNPVKDFITPRARGWLTVQMERPERANSYVAPSTAHEAHAIISSFDELDAALEKLEAELGRGRAEA
jgi:putative hydrolase of the HAD superfamily